MVTGTDPMLCYAMLCSDPVLCYAMRGKIRQFSCFFDNFCYFCFFDQFKAILDPFWISGPHVSMFFLNTYFAMPFWLCFFFYKIQRTEKHEKLSKPRESQWPGKSFLWSLEPKNQSCESQPHHVQTSLKTSKPPSLQPPSASAGDAKRRQLIEGGVNRKG